MEVRHSTELKFTDISSEDFREYADASGVFYRIDKPLWLAVSASGNHRVLDAAGVSHAIDLKARCGIRWRVAADKPHFVR